jgi:hypothetical protein
MDVPGLVVENDDNNVSIDREPLGSLTVWSPLLMP